ncbi:protein YgfX [Methylophaga sp.]|uniref:protein YgfX n=1 Tax=Methylophaga sp. TaxID=2024840 RepID=UPI003F696AA9
MTVWIRRSTLILTYLFAIHILAFGSVWLVLDQLLVSITLILLVLVHFIFLARQYQWLPCRNYLTKLVFHSDHTCSLEFADKGKKGPFMIKGSVLFNPGLVLYLKPLQAGFNKPVFIARDAVEPDIWRLLRVKLRDPDFWGK